MAIYKIVDADASVTYCISSHHTWLPGVYESIKAARYAFRFTNEELEELQTSANLRAAGSGGMITFAALQALRQRKKQDTPDLKEKAHD